MGLPNKSKKNSNKKLMFFKKTAKTPYSALTNRCLRLIYRLLIV